MVNGIKPFLKSEIMISLKIVKGLNIVLGGAQNVTLFIAQKSSYKLYIVIKMQFSVILLRRFIFSKFPPKVL